MLNAFVHGCVMNNILMIIITLHSIEKSSNITHPYTNALSTHIYVCYVQNMVIQILLYIYNWHIQRNVVHKIHIYVCYMQLYMCV